MRTDRLRTMFAAPSIVILTAGQPMLHRLACRSVHGRLTASAAIAIRARISDGYYDSPAIADAIARRLLAADAIL